jgi:hypothetical protein
VGEMVDDQTANQMDKSLKKGKKKKKKEITGSGIVELQS